MSVDNTDYDDIYDNTNDYEYPYNHINRSKFVTSIVYLYISTRALRATNSK